MNQTIPALFRILFLMGGFICLAFGVASGLMRLGWSLPALAADIATLHGALMISGFLGTVISLERAVAIGRRWAYLGPFSAAAGSFALLTGAYWFGICLIILASLVLLLASANIFVRQRAMFTFTLLLGSLYWVIGNLLWVSGVAIVQLVPWWMGFLVLTIAGERLELTRMLPPSRCGSWLFIGVVALCLCGAVATTLSATANIVVFSAALTLLALWLIWNDIARKTVRQHALTRFIAVCLLSGYAWLLVGGLIGLWAATLQPGSSYDAFLHAILAGFVFSMIFGHAPVIFPAVTGFKIPYHPAFYVPLVVLHLSLALRIGGDLTHLANWRSIGAALNALALVLFILNMVTAVVRGKRPAINDFQPRHQ